MSEPNKLRRMFWGIFVAAQLMGVLGVATGSPHGNPLGLVFMMLFLFPGSILCWYAFEMLKIPPVGDMMVRIIVTSFLINLPCWYILLLLVSKVRLRKSE